MYLVKDYIVKPATLLLLLVLYCEYVHYYVVLYQCSRPYVTDKQSDDVLHAMLLADTHLLGPRKGHWFDKLRREWQMYRTFQTAVSLHKPEVIFFLGDLLDEGQSCTDDQFNDYVERFHSLFQVPEDTEVHIAVGNHDIGFHYWINSRLLNRFTRAFLAKPVQFLTIKQNHFVLLNSMAMEMDGCSLCKPAEQEIRRVGTALTCAKNNQICNPSYNITQYSQPILLQHFPLYRTSDENCSEPDEAPPGIKSNSFRENWDCLSRQATSFLFKELKPRLIFDGHTHHGCHRVYSNGAEEWTLSSFNWRNKNNPSFTLASFHAGGYKLEKCYIPQESTVIYIYMLGGICIGVMIIYKIMKRKRYGNAYVKLAKVR